MRRFGVKTILTFGFAMVLFAISSAHAQPQLFVPNEAERRADPLGYPRLPGFPNSIEFIRDGVFQDENISRYLSPERQAYVRNSGLAWLDVREPVLMIRHAVRSGDRVSVPVALGIRYFKSGLGFLTDGTINARLLFSLGDQRLIAVEYQSFDDNERIQAVGRRLFLNASETPSFISEIAGETLMRYFADPAAFEALSALLTQRLQRTILYHYGPPRL